jgi:transposase
MSRLPRLRPRCARPAPGCDVVEAKDTENAVLRAQLEAYQAQLQELRAEVEALRARLGQNPRNSSKPPSSEGLAKPSPRSLRGKSGRKPGRPKAQPGATLELIGHPDTVISHEPGRCSGCGAGWPAPGLPASNGGR